MRKTCHKHILWQLNSKMWLMWMILATVWLAAVAQIYWINSVVCRGEKQNLIWHKEWWSNDYKQFLVHTYILSPSVGIQFIRSTKKQNNKSMKIKQPRNEKPEDEFGRKTFIILKQLCEFFRFSMNVFEI